MQRLTWPCFGASHLHLQVVHISHKENSDTVAYISESAFCSWLQQLCVSGSVKSFFDPLFLNNDYIKKKHKIVLANCRDDSSKASDSSGAGFSYCSSCPGVNYKCSDVEQQHYWTALQQRVCGRRGRRAEMSSILAKGSHRLRIWKILQLPHCKSPFGAVAMGTFFQKEVIKYFSSLYISSWFSHI